MADSDEEYLSDIGEAPQIEVITEEEREALLREEEKLFEEAVLLEEEKLFERLETVRRAGAENSVTEEHQSVLERGEDTPSAEVSSIFSTNPQRTGTSSPMAWRATTPTVLGAVTPAEMGAVTPAEMGAVTPAEMGAAAPPDMRATTPVMSGVVTPPQMRVTPVRRARESERVVDASDLEELQETEEVLVGESGADISHEDMDTTQEEIGNEEVSYNMPCTDVRERDNYDATKAEEEIARIRRTREQERTKRQPKKTVASVIVKPETTPNVVHPGSPMRSPKGADDGKATCPECSLRVTKKNMKRHHMHMHAETLLVWNCPHCRNPYLRRSDMLRHLERTHGYSGSTRDAVVTSMTPVKIKRELYTHLMTQQYPSASEPERVGEREPPAVPSRETTESSSPASATDTARIIDSPFARMRARGEMPKSDVTYEGPFGPDMRGESQSSEEREMHEVSCAVKGRKTTVRMSQLITKRTSLGLPCPTMLEAQARLDRGVTWADVRFWIETYRAPVVRDTPRSEVGTPKKKQKTPASEGQSTCTAVWSDSPETPERDRKTPSKAPEETEAVVEDVQRAETSSDHQRSVVFDGTRPKETFTRSATEEGSNNESFNWQTSTPYEIRSRTSRENRTYTWSDLDTFPEEMLEPNTEGLQREGQEILSARVRTISEWLHRIDSVTAPFRTRREVLAERFRECEIEMSRRQTRAALQMQEYEKERERAKAREIALEKQLKEANSAHSEAEARNRELFLTLQEAELRLSRMENLLSTKDKEINGLRVQIPMAGTSSLSTPVMSPAPRQILETPTTPLMPMVPAALEGKPPVTPGEAERALQIMKWVVENEQFILGGGGLRSVPRGENTGVVYMPAPAVHPPSSEDESTLDEPMDNTPEPPP